MRSCGSVPFGPGRPPARAARSTRGQDANRRTAAAEAALRNHRSAASLAALLTVAGLAVGGGTEVLVLHVDDHGQPEEGRRLASDIASALIACAVNARPELRQARRGQVGAEIAAAAAEHGSDLVMLGSQGQSHLGGLLLGSVGFEVLERVRCLVLLVRAGRRASGRGRRVLVAVAGDEDITELVRTTAAVAEVDAHVLVLHLLAPGDDDLQAAISEQLVQQMVTGLRRCGVRARGRVRAVRRNTAQLPGIRQVEVDIPGKVVAVDFDETAIDVGRMSEALAEAEYPVASSSAG